MATRFIHTADWQLGKPYERISTEGDKKSQASQARFNVLEKIGERIKAHQAEFVLVAGDLFDSTTPSNPNISKAFDYMGKWKVPVFIIPGNHDHGGPASLWENNFLQGEMKRLAPLVKIILSRDLVIHGDVVIYPCPLLRRSDTSDLTAWLRDPSVHPTEHSSKTRIILAHGTVQGFGSSSDEEDDAPGESNLIDVKRIAADDFDYIALGDWHGTTDVTDKAWYSGTPEIDRFPKGENNDPGNILEVVASRGEKPFINKTRTTILNWVSFEHQFTHDEEVAQLESKIVDKHLASTDKVLIKIHLKGSLGISASDELEKLIERIEARSIRLKLKNETTIAPTDEEISALCNDAQNPLIAAVAQKLVQLVNNPAESSRARIALRELYSTYQS